MTVMGRKRILDEAAAWHTEEARRQGGGDRGRRGGGRRRSGGDRQTRRKCAWLRAGGAVGATSRCPRTIAAAATAAESPRRWCGSLLPFARSLPSPSPLCFRSARSRRRRRSRTAAPSGAGLARCLAPTAAACFCGACGARVLTPTSGPFAGSVGWQLLCELTEGHMSLCVWSPMDFKSNACRADKQYPTFFIRRSIG